MENYCIKTGYKVYDSDTNLTLDENRDSNYWNKGRVQMGVYFQWMVYEHVARQVHRGANVVDIGSGSGYKLVHIVGKKTDNIYGVDQRQAIQFCEKTYAKGKWIADDFENPKQQNEIPSHVDIIICSDVIEHLVDPGPMLSYIKMIANSETLIFLSTPDRDRMRGKSCMESTKPEHVREWNYTEFANYISGSGFTIIDHLHMYPLKLSFWNIKTYLQIFFAKFVGRDGQKFKYNQLIKCKFVK